MNHTLLELREEIADTAGISGLEVDSDKLRRLINNGARALLEMQDWQSSVDQYRFKVYDPYIVLPASLRKITHFAIDGSPIEMRSPWFEFVQHGPGIIEDDNRIDLLLERNRTPVFRNVPADGSWNLVVKAFVDERVSVIDPDDCCDEDVGVPPVVNIRGTLNDSVIYSTNADGKHIQGEDIIINHEGGFSSESTKIFSHIESFNKPVTTGQIELYAKSGNVQHLLAIYAPYERTPSYRSYTFPGLEKCKEQTVLIRAKREHVPMIHDNDISAFGSVQAIKAMVISETFFLNQKQNEYLSWRDTALSLQLDHEASSHNKTKLPYLSFGEGFGNGPTEIGELY